MKICQQVLICLLLGFVHLPAQAQMREMPHFFDAREKFNVPDLGRWQRIVFLTTVDFPPFNYLDSTGALSGYHVDLARNICMELQIENKCQIEARPWAELLLSRNLSTSEAASAGRSSEVIIAGLAPTAQNRLELAFTRAYMRLPARFVALKRITATANLVENLPALKIGLVRARAHERLFAVYFPTLTPLLFDDEEKLVNALKTQEIDLGFGDGLRFSLLFSSQADDDCCVFVGGGYFAPAYLGEGMRIAVPLHNKALVEAFNHALQSLEKKNKLRELYLKYFPFDFY